MNWYSKRVSNLFKNKNYSYRSNDYDNSSRYNKYRYSNSSKYRPSSSASSKTTYTALESLFNGGV